MIYIFAIFILVSLVGLSFKNIKNIDNEALTLERTTMINGFFVGLVLFSHFNSYVITNSSIDSIYYFIFKMGQLMVTTFLFYSGYGIYESIKNKKNYINNFFKNRVVKLFVSVFLALILYIVLNIIIGEEYSIKTILLSPIGLTSIGNSNWFIFATFCMYFSVLISFKIFKKDNLSALLLCLILSFGYIFLVMKFLGYSWWVDTILCFNAGMFFSYFKESILCLLMVIIFALSIINNYNYFTYEIISLSFVLIIVLISLKVKIGNKVLLWLGKNTFNIYILQRLSYILYQYLGLANYNIYLYFGVSVLTTIVLTYFFDKILKKVYKLVIK